MNKKQARKALRKQREARASLIAELDGIVNRAASETRDFTADENVSRGRLEAQIAQADLSVEARENDLRQAKKDARKAKMQAQVASMRRELGLGEQRSSGLAFDGQVSVTSESRTYEKGNGRSYLLDLALARTALGQGLGVRSMQAQERLLRHAQENHVLALEQDDRIGRMAEDKRHAELMGTRDGYFLRQMVEIHNHRDENRGPIAHRALSYRALSTAATAGGEFVPPMYLTADWIQFARPGRVLADLQHKESLPDGTMSINIPKVTGGTSVATSGVQNTNVSNTSLQTAFVTFPVVIKAGSQIVSLALLERSPIEFDQVVGRDMALAQAQDVNTSIHSGTGTAADGGPDIVGILNTSGINTVTWTQSTPTIKGLYGQIGVGKNDVAQGRKLPATHQVLTSNCWEWIVQTFDSNNRPLVVPSYNDPFNAAVVPSDNATAQGVVGHQLQQLATFEDLTLPTDLGAGTNQDVLIGGRFDENYLYESPITTRMLPQTYGMQMSMLMQLYGYAAYTAARYPVANFVVTGTGMASANRVFNS